MNLQPLQSLLLAQLGASSAAEPAAQAWATSAPRAGLDTTAPPGYYPFLTALATAQADKKTGQALRLVVTPTGREAETLAGILSQFGQRVAVFPAWETLPHERLSPRPDTMARRIAVARRLAHPDPDSPQGGPLDIVVAPVRAVAQPFNAQIAQLPAVSVRVGRSLSLEKLLADLVALGYQRQDLVSRRGELAVRGGLIDVFPGHLDHPVRVEFFGDEVDEIRFFNVSDQRTFAPAPQGLWAVACREILLDEPTRQRASQLAPQLPGAAELLSEAAAGIYAEGLESLSGVLCENMISLLDLLPAGSLVIATDPQRLSGRLEELVATTEEFLAAAWSQAAGGGQVPLQTRQASFLTAEQIRHLSGEKNLGWWNLGPIHAGGAQSVDAAVTPASALVKPGENPLVAVGRLVREGYFVFIGAGAEGPARRVVSLLTDAGVAARLESEIDTGPAALASAVVQVAVANVGEGFALTGEGTGEATGQKIAIFSDNYVLGRRVSTRGPAGRMPARRRATVDPLQLKEGDFVVHNHHGVGRFVKLAKRTMGRGASQVSREYVVLEYAPSRRGGAGDQLWVPSDSLDQLSKYVGGESPALSKMGGADWQKTKQKAKKAVREIAAELIRLYAARQATPGFAFSPDTPWQRELEDAFAYVETPDQLATIEEVKADMEKPIPMDRLICGDVGYGKTEIAVRAAFKAVQDGKQVAILAPTTLLVNQHLETFTERYAGFPIEVAALSRFTTAKEARRIKEEVLGGKIEVVIGTHALLTGQVQFKDLGLVIIDEEQRFGVEHKEALKALRTNVDVLAMSATPIPRTLEMAVSGIREMSTLTTPPEERHPVLTYVGAYTDQQVVAAVKRELLRDGQVFFVHNRVETINQVAKHLQDMLPEARVAVAHGQLGEAALEKVMIDFWNGEYDVLVCTTIIETGLDISNANTIIIDRADAMGLSQLHQLRGRVGRSRERGYAYFLYPQGKTLTQTAFERLRTIGTHTELGSGMAVAQKDLEIRGAGNLLGGAQSGHIAGVGFDLYVRMVSEAVAAFRGESETETVDVSVELPVDAYVPEDYVSAEALRLEAYTRISNTTDQAGLEQISEELADRYGSLPAPLQRLLKVAALRHLARSQGIADISARGKDIKFAPVTLAASQMARLNRLHPGARVKLATREVLIPAPVVKNGLALTPVVDEKLLEWTGDVIKNILTPF